MLDAEHKTEERPRLIDRVYAALQRLPRIRAKSKRLPHGIPYLAIEAASVWYGWRPRIWHDPGAFSRDTSRFRLVAPGTRMTQASTHLAWGVFTVGFVWPSDWDRRR